MKKHYFPPKFFNFLSSCLKLFFYIIFLIQPIVNLLFCKKQKKTKTNKKAIFLKAEQTETY